MGSVRHTTRAVLLHADAHAKPDRRARKGPARAHFALRHSDRRVAARLCREDSRGACVELGAEDADDAFRERA